MPTGYTSYIFDKGYDFKKFAMLCTRAFGALVDLRDESIDTPVPKKLKADSYHKKALEDSKKELTRLEKISDSELLSELIMERRRQLDSLRRANEKILKDGDLCSKVLAEAMNWIPPTKDHEKFKNFMIEQLEGTLDHDCDISYYTREIGELESELEDLTDVTTKIIAQYRNDMISSERDSIQRHETRYKEDVERVEGNQEWLDAIRESLK